MTTVLLVITYGGTRLIFAISRDGLLPAVFAKISSKTHVPVANTWIFAVVTSIVAMVVPLDKIAELVNISAPYLPLQLFHLGVIFLKNYQTTMSCHKGSKYRSILSYESLDTGLCVLLMTHLQLTTWIVFVIWFVIGLA